MLLHTLRGQYEGITGESDVMFRKQKDFQEIWIKGRDLQLFWGENKVEICSTS